MNPTAFPIAGTCAANFVFLHDWNSLQLVSSFIVRSRSKRRFVSWLNVWLLYPITFRNEAWFGSHVKWHQKRFMLTTQISHPPADFPKIDSIEVKLDWSLRSWRGVQQRSLPSNSGHRVFVSLKRRGLVLPPSAGWGWQEGEDSSAHSRWMEQSEWIKGRRVYRK